MLILYRLTPLTRHVLCAVDCLGRYYCLSGADSATDCPAGYYCPEGTRWSTEYGCPIGTFSDSTNIRTSSECTSCTAGQLVYMFGVFWQESYPDSFIINDVGLSASSLIYITGRVLTSSEGKYFVPSLVEICSRCC